MIPMDAHDDDPPAPAFARTATGEAARCAARCADDLRAVAERGDREAFARLFSFFAPRIKGFMMRLGASEQQAEELAQETMLAVWRKAALYDPARSGPAAWIYAVARNRRADAWRRRHAATRMTADVEREELEALPDDGPGPEERLVGDRRDRAVRAALAVLPAEQKTVVELSFFAELAHPAIAERLGLPLGTVKSRLRLAMEKIRRALEEYAP